MIEKFNGNFKLMLKRMCAEKPNDWDRYIAPLLFAYREAPHDSLGGFSPFELLYGRQVRGPLRILKELMTKEDTDPEVKTVYLKDMLQETCKVAHDMLEKASKRYKQYYDRTAKPRNLQVDDQVLVLLPTDHNKLLLQWKGPYTILHRFNDCDYKIKMGTKVKSFHINMLKKYNQPVSATTSACLFDLSCSTNEIPEEFIVDYSLVMASVEVLNEPEINDGKAIVPLPLANSRTR
jgi:hypothetical protein